METENSIQLISVLCGFTLIVVGIAIYWFFKKKIFIVNNYTPSTYPYQLNFDNPSDEPKTVVIFGMNTYLLHSNFGSTDGVVVSSAHNNNTYLELLQASASRECKVSLIRIKSDNINQLKESLIVTSKDLNGWKYEQTILTNPYFSPNRIDDKVLDITLLININGDTDIKFTILPKTKMSMSLFPNSNDIKNKTKTFFVKK